MFNHLSPEQLEFRNNVRKLAQAKIPAYQNDDSSHSLPRQLFTDFASLGLTGLSIGEEFSGLGEGLVTSTLIMQEISRVDLGPAIFLSVHLMVSGLISRFGSNEQKSFYLPKLAKGEMLAAFALTEANAGSDASALKSSAKKCGENYIINGSKIYITSGGFADLYLVFAKTDPQAASRGISAFLVEKNSSGFSFSAPEKKMGCELSPICSIFFDNMSVPASQLLGQENQGYAVALAGLAGGRINIAACANGLSTEAIERATNYLKERSQFGKKLAEFQGLQFMLADMRMQLEAAELLTWQAAREKDLNPSSDENLIYPSLAKCFATDAAMKITTDAVQLFGGAGYIREHVVERLMRDAKMLQIVEGTNQVQRMVIAREILK
jgi:alkylation response protein AidB-like acyl-CoA dehydrogenase